MSNIEEKVTEWLDDIDYRLVGDVSDDNELISLYELIELLKTEYYSFRKKYGKLDKIDALSVINCASCEKTACSKWLKMNLSPTTNSSFVSSDVKEYNLHIVKRDSEKPRVLLFDKNMELMTPTCNIPADTLEGYINLFSEHATLFNLCERLRLADSLLIIQNGITVRMTINKFNKWVAESFDNISISLENRLGNYRINIDIDLAKGEMHHQIFMNLREYKDMSTEKLMQKIRFNRKLFNLKPDGKNRINFTSAK